MSTPQQSNNAPRRSARKQKQVDTPTGPQTKVAVSDHESAQLLHNPTVSETPVGNGKGRKKAQPNKKSGGTDTYAPVHHDRSMPSVLPASKTKATPIKQAYAGPTFHNSPAASALPMPSFYSKSVPNVSSIKPPDVANDSGAQQEESIAQNESPAKRESTPLDFLFNAARQARRTPRAESPSAHSVNLSVTAGSPASRSPGPRDPESVFPFELDGASTPGEDGSSFSTPYKERIEALKSTRSTSDGTRSMDEHERKAKTEALKKLLMHSQNQKNDKQGADMNNPFNARVPQNRNHLESPRPQGRHHSGPSTPSYSQNYPTGPGNPGQYFPNMHQPQYYAPYQISPNRPPSSNLRRVYGAESEPEPAEMSSDNAIVSPQMPKGRRQLQQPTPQHAYGAQPSPPRQYNQSPTHRSAPSAQQLEDDLRRVLKLDLTSRG